MKNAFSLFLLLTCFAASSCGSSSLPAESSSMEEVNKLKSLLSKQDLSPTLAKMFVSDYDFFSSSSMEGDESETQFHSYHGGGMMGCFYEVDEASYQEVEALESRDFFDYLARGNGSYGMMQTATLASYSHEFDEEGANASLQGVGFLQRLETYFGESDVQVFNSLSSTDKIGEAYDKRQYFNGIIDKETLFDTITVRAFSDIFASTNLYDGQRSCEALDRIYFDIVKDLHGKTDAELNDFIKKNDIAIEEEEENTLVRFRLKDENLRAVLDENDIIPGVLEGTLTYEKESGKFSAYDYKIAYVENGQDEENGKLFAASMAFAASGYSWNQKYEEALYIEPNPTVYDCFRKFIHVLRPFYHIVIFPYDSNGQE